MEDKVVKFNKFEIILFRIQMINLGFSAVFFGALMLLLSEYKETAQIFYGLVIFLMFASLVLFIIALVRIFKYFISLKALEGIISIWRSIVVLLTSPIAIIIYWLLLFILALSMASCST